MNLCKFGIHRWEIEEEGSTLQPTIKRCKDCGAVIKDRAIGTVYHVPEGTESRFVNLDKTILTIAAGGLLVAAFILLKRRK